MAIRADLIHPYETNDLIRIGQDKDGGYVINKRLFEHTRILIGLGINADWSFEEDFARHAAGGLRIYGYDFSVSREIFRKEYVSRLLYLFSIKFFLRLAKAPHKMFALIKENLTYASNARKTYKAFPRFFDGVKNKFFQIGISNEKRGPFVLFDEVIQNLPDDTAPHSVFLKIDIEFSEYRIMDDVFRYSHLFSGMAIEFHELDIVGEQFNRIMLEAKKDFIVTHVHGNNYDSLIPGSNIPKGLEITFIHRSLEPGEPVLSTRTYPLPGLDFPNDPSRKDFVLTFL